MTKKFKESKFSLNFQKELFGKISALINQSQNICLISLKGVGSTIFFKHLASSGLAKFVYLDCHLVTSINEQNFFNLILKELGSEADCKNKEEFLGKATKIIDSIFKKATKIVIICNHFNHLEKIFGRDFFNVLRNLEETYPGRLSFVFHLYKPILEIISESELGFNVNLFIQTLYLKPYSVSDLVQITRALFDSEAKDEWVSRAIDLSGGHSLLLRLLLRTSQIENPVLDPFIKLSLKELLASFSYRQRKTIEKIAEEKPEGGIDPFLLDTGFVTQKEGKYRLFTPLICSYIKSNSHLKLSANEEKLFKLLKKNRGKLISKDEIFSYVWEEDTFASDWALNSMIYRLRQNPVFKQQGYVIENHKKRGYILIKD